MPYHAKQTELSIEVPFKLNNTELLSKSTIPQEVALLHVECLLGQEEECYMPRRIQILHFQSQQGPIQESNAVLMYFM